MSDDTIDIENHGQGDEQSHAQSNGQGDLIPCMLMKLVDGYMLAPKVSVAELAPIQPFDIIPNTPDWFLGYYPWRNLRVPVLSYETMNMQSSPKIGVGGQVAVLHTTGISDRLPFLGMLVQDSPQELSVSELEISEDAKATKKTYDLMPVKVGIELAVLPDIEAIEQAVLALNLLR